MKKSILWVDDNPNASSTIHSVLRKRGYRVVIAETLKKAQDAISENLNLVIMDALMPDGNALDFCNQIHTERNLPVLIHSALDSNDDIISGLSSGADDYLIKPCDLNVLCAHIEALLRRYDRRTPDKTILKYGKLEIDFTAGRAFLGKKDLNLTRTEFAILKYLVQYQNRYISADELYRNLWANSDETKNVHKVWVHVSRVRKKLGDRPTVDIVSARNKGYKLILK